MQEQFSYSQIARSPVPGYLFSMTLNVQIRSIRQARSMTLADLAAKVGISTPHLSEVERGKKNLNNHLLVRISEALGVEPTELIGGSSNDQFSDLNQKIHELSEQDRQRVESFIDALLASKDAT